MRPGFLIAPGRLVLGCDGVADLVDCSCARAREFAQLLSAESNVRILNDVVLNQVRVRFGDNHEVTRAVIAGVQQDDTCCPPPVAGGPRHLRYP